MNVLDFTLGAISLAVGLIAQPYVMSVWYAIKSRIRRGKNIKVDMLANTNKIELGVLKQKVDDLEKQVDNLAQVVSTRDRNRKSNIFKRLFC